MSRKRDRNRKKWEGKARLPHKLICGVLHHQVACSKCKQLCWTQLMEGYAKNRYLCQVCAGNSFRSERIDP